MTRNYRQEYDRYQGTLKQKQARARRNSARRLMEKEGKVKKGDGKDVAHMDNRTTNNNKSNLRVQAPSKNRSFKRNKKAGRA
jgi:hypothetical protein